MPIPVSCGECRTDYEFESSDAGRRYRCRTCGTTLEVPIFEETTNGWLNEDSLEPVGASLPHARVLPPGMGRIRTGLALIYFSLQGSVLLVMGGVPLTILTQRREVAAVMIGGLIACTLVSLTGRIYCLSGPPGLHGTGLIRLASILDVVAMAGGLHNLGHQANPLVGMARLVSVLLFLMFLKRLAEAVGRDDLVQLAQSIFRLGGAAAILFGSSIIALMVVPPFSVIGLLAGLFTLLACGIRYATLLRRLKNAL